MMKMVLVVEIPNGGCGGGGSDELWRDYGGEGNDVVVM